MISLPPLLQKSTNYIVLWRRKGEKSICMTYIWDADNQRGSRRMNYWWQSVWEQPCGLIFMAINHPLMIRRQGDMVSAKSIRDLVLPHKGLLREVHVYEMLKPLCETTSFHHRNNHTLCMQCWRKMNLISSDKFRMQCSGLRTICCLIRQKKLTQLEMLS